MSSVAEKQKSLLDSIDNVVNQRISQMSKPTIQVGVVAQDPSGFKCIVDIQGIEKECTIPEHLHDWISKDDIVYVTDINGKGMEYVVTGSSGTTRSGSMVIQDEEKNRFVSGVTKFENDESTLDDNEFIIK